MKPLSITRLFDNDWIGPALVSGLAIAIISFFQPSFLTPFNIFVLLSAIAVNMLVALGQLVIIAVGQMNLALGSIGGLVAISFAAMMELWGLPPLVAVLGGLMIGVLAGMASGFVIARTGITAFIITLAGLQIFKGINLGITEAQPFYGVPQSVKDFGNTSIFGPIPWLVVPMLILSVAIWYLFARLRIGRYILAIGGNRRRSQCSRVSVRQINPRAKRAMKLMASGVTCSAASTRSPSFSRSSSSTRITMRPAASSATSSGMGEMGINSL